MRSLCLAIVLSVLVGCAENSQPIDSLTKRVEDLENQVAELRKEHTEMLAAKEETQKEQTPQSPTAPVTEVVPTSALQVAPGEYFKDAEGQEVKRAGKVIEYAGFHPDVPGKGMLNYWSSSSLTTSGRTVLLPTFGDVVRSLPFRLSLDQNTLVIHKIDAEGVASYTIE